LYFTKNEEFAGIVVVCATTLLELNIVAAPAPVYPDV
jgi:hypothetical protein